jgi:uracil-DNA glycosylase
MINPEIIVPIGQRTLDALATDYTTNRPGDVDVADAHATTIRGRGFELVPMLELTAQTDADSDAFVEHLVENVFSRDYRQTKGRRGR